MVVGGRRPGWRLGHAIQTKRAPHLIWSRPTRWAQRSSSMTGSAYHTRRRIPPSPLCRSRMITHAAVARQVLGYLEAYARRFQLRSNSARRSRPRAMRTTAGSRGAGCATCRRQILVSRHGQYARANPSHPGRGETAFRLHDPCASAQFRNGGAFEIGRCWWSASAIPAARSPIDLWELGLDRASRARSGERDPRELLGIPSWRSASRAAQSYRGSPMP